MVRASYSGFLPTITADAGYRKSAGTGEATNTERISEEYSYGLNGKQNLFAGFRDSAAIARAKAELEGAEARLLTAKSKLSFDLKSAFSEISYALEQQRLTKEIAERRKSNVRLVELRFEGGRENKGSFLRSKAQHRQAQYEVSQSERSTRVAERQLLRVLGMSEAESVEISGGWPRPELSVRPNLKEMALVTPQYRLAAAEARAAERGVTAARAQFLPSLFVNASLGKAGSEFPPASNRWSVGVSLSLPIFDGAKNIFDYQAAKAEERRAEASLASVRDQTFLKLEEAFAAFHDAVEKTEVQEEFQRAAELRAQVSRSKYTTGLISFEDWDLIENDLISTQKARLLGLKEAWISEAAWEQARGTGVIP